MPALIDAIAEVDRGQHPLVWNDNHFGVPTNITGLHRPGLRAFAMLHYRNLGCDRSHDFTGGICEPLRMISGLGECAWCIANGMEGFAAIAVNARRFDAAYVAGWDWLNYWPNFLQGMNFSRHAWHQKPCVHADRTPGVDGWGSPVVDWVQRAFHPHLVFDIRAYQGSPSFVLGWPGADPAVVKAGSPFERSLMLFNDVVAPAASDRLALVWSGHFAGACEGPAVVQGAVNATVRPGFHAQVTIGAAAPTPPEGQGQAELWLVYKLFVAGDLKYVEDRGRVIVSR